VKKAKRKWPVEPGLDKFGLYERVGYRPYPGQEEFHRSKARWRLLCAGARYGKSKCGAMEALWFLLHPGVHIWAVGPTYELASKEFRYVVDAVMELKHQGFRIPVVRLTDNLNSGQLRLEVDWSPEGDKRTEYMSWFVCKSWNEPTSLLGEELDLILLSEGSQCPRFVWERYLRARLGSRLGRLVIPTTPKGLDDFLHPLFYQPAVVEGHKDYWCGQYGVWDNPDFDRQEVEDARRTLDAATFAEQYGGEFVSFVGRVYGEFARKTHVIEPFEIPPEWPRWRTIDYGYEDPFCCLWVASDGDGRLYVYREHYVKRQLLSWHCDRIRERSAGEHIDYTVIDPNAKQKRLESGMSILGHMAELGIPCIPGNNDIDSGIFRAMEWMKVDPLSGKPGVFVFSSCVNMIGELEKYSWAKANEGKNQGLKPQDANNHSADCFRYLVMTRPRRYTSKDVMPANCVGAYKRLLKKYRDGRNSDLIGAEQRPSVIYMDRL